jgi:hypothetical protein
LIRAKRWDGVIIAIAQEPLAYRPLGIDSGDEHRTTFPNGRAFNASSHPEVFGEATNHRSRRI